MTDIEPPAADTLAVAEMMHVMGQTVRTSPTVDITPEERLLRVRLVLEEAFEFATAMGCWVSMGPPNRVQVDINPSASIDLIESTDALADLIVVTKGSAHTLGVPIDQATQIVHATNMAKTPGGVVIRDAGGKVQKPEGWEPPTVALAALLGVE